MTEELPMARIVIIDKYGCSHSDEIQQVAHETDEAFMARVAIMIQKLKERLP